ncbi:MAG: hypothetical protein HQL32_01995 [Planctomycetes bacterium]|nr:hypothetical protein [Planctomycetota bacterium]
MNATKSKKRDSLFLKALIERAPRVSLYESTANLLEQIIDNILSEREEDDSMIQGVKDKLLVEYVDWNEIRLVSPDRLAVFFEALVDGEYKRKVLQAFLNKIFSRTGSLEHSFLNDFEDSDLDDYLAGIMEMREETRKRILLRVFKRHILPISVDHEVIFEIAETTYYPGDEDMKAAFSALSLEELEGVKLLLDEVLSQNKGEIDELAPAESFESPLLGEILKEVDAA